MAECERDVFQWPGNPNGHVQATGPAICQEVNPDTGVVEREWIMPEGMSGTVWQ